MTARTAGRGPVAALLPSRWPDLLLALLVLWYGYQEAQWLSAGWSFGVHRTVLVMVLTAVAVALFRTLPGTALGLVWLTTAVQLLIGPGVLQTQLAVAFVAYGAARYGSTAVLWLSGASLPCGAVMALLIARRHGIDLPVSISRLVRPLGVAPLEAIGLIGAALLAIIATPWLLGLLLRVRAKAAQDQAQAEARRIRIEAERAQAQQIAELRDGQARLARDVHDVVGHSLAVILVQAESAGFLPDGDTAAMRRTMENIAASARQSLREVREVLASTDAEHQRATPPQGSLETLLEGVESAGNPLRATVVGTPQPLPPELETVAFRVLQEMLTNALKHGLRGEPVVVERQWDRALRLEVRNVVAREPRIPDGASGEGPATGRGGSGIEGMHRRLEAVGGRLDVRRTREADTGPVFTATAWMPLRTGETA
ncbi:sensor histidine kinase [Streptacidiphilus sp. PAMC 29251]